jgi:hypothetical protein
MPPHARLWWLLFTILLFVVVTTALCGEGPQPAPAAAPTLVQAPPAPAPAVPDVRPSAQPATVLAATLLLHLLATAVGLRAGMKIFYESTMFGGFCVIVLVDLLLVVAMTLLGPATDGFTTMLGPQLVVTALAMVITLHHFGFTKDRFTVIPTVLVAKAFGFFGEVALRMLFLEALLRYAATQGL